MIDILTGKQINSIQIHRQTDRDTDRQTDRQIDRQIDRQTDRHTECQIFKQKDVHRQLDS